MLMSWPVLPDDWQAALADEYARSYFQALQCFLSAELANHTVYPAQQDWFRAFALCPLVQVRVVIVGQDPYHGPDQADGLCFSVRAGVAIPPSLRNIRRELSADLGVNLPATGDLSGWAKQGVLLLNSVLTVRAGKAASHANRGWERWTDAVIRQVALRDQPTVFLLWGRYAQAKGAGLDRTRHCVLEAAHPSPLAAHQGFFGSRPFSQANRWLAQQQQPGIAWVSEW